MRLLVIFIALVLAVIAGVGFWFATSNKEQSEIVVAQPQATTVQVQEVNVLVARKDIPVGHRLTEEDIDRQPWPQHLVLDEFMKAEEGAGVIDMVTRTPFKEHEPFAKSRLANPNDPGFLAAQLPPGMRAVTIAIDAITGISGFVYPGDRVDVLITHNVGLEQDYNDGSGGAALQDGEAPAPSSATTAISMPVLKSYRTPVLMTPSKHAGQPVIGVTEVLVPNVRVLAVGDQSYQYNNADKTIPTSITLQVSDKDAQRLRHAEIGTLSLALRSLEDGDDIAVTRPIADADMSRLLPPAYFPFVYEDKGYKAESVDLEDTGYAEMEAAVDRKGAITIVRGVQKEIVGVDRP